MKKVKPKNKWRDKVYQPKYPLPRAQQRQPRQVFVPTQILKVQRLHNGDEHKWVQRQATQRTDQVAGSLLSCHWKHKVTTREIESYGYKSHSL